MSMRNVLGVLEDPDDRLWSTFAAAVALADAERARLTLVKTYTAGHLCMWCGPFAAGGIYVPPDSEDPQATAGRALARAAEFVPMEIPVTTMVLGLETERELRRLVERGAYDALVASDELWRHSRRLRRECQRDGVEIVGVTPGPGHEPGARDLPAPVTTGVLAG